MNRDILRLEENPRPQGVEKMETKEKIYRIYVGPGKKYRAIYQIRDDVLLVLLPQGQGLVPGGTAPNTIR